MKDTDQRDRTNSKGWFQLSKREMIKARTVRMGWREEK